MTATLTQDIPLADPSAESGHRGPLSPSQLSQLDEANRSAAKLRRAAGVASFSAWSMASFSAMTLPFGLLSLSSLITGIALGAFAWNEFRGRRLLLALDESGPRTLANNQLLLMAMLTIYSLWNIYSALASPGELETQLQAMPELQTSLGSLNELYKTVTIGVYGGLIIFSVIFQGLQARYYSTRQRLLTEHIKRTPAWVLELQRRSL